MIALVGLVVTVLALVGGVIYRLGRHSSRFDQLDQQIADTRREIRETREEFRREIHETREEFRREIHETREENRRNHQQLLQALAHHAHDSDTGFAIFHVPPGTENPAA